MTFLSTFHIQSLIIFNNYFSTINIPSLESGFGDQDGIVFNDSDKDDKIEEENEGGRGRKCV